MYPYQTSHYSFDCHNNYSENPKRKRDEYESYKFIEDEEQISSDSEDEELQLMQGFQPDKKRTKSSSTSTIQNDCSYQQQLQQSHNNNNNNNNNFNNSNINDVQHHYNNESGSIVYNGDDRDDDCMMMDEGDDDGEGYVHHHQRQQQQLNEEPSLQLSIPSNLQNDLYSIQQFEYKRRQMYNHYRKEQERKMEKLELKQSMEHGETNFRLNPILRYLHNERKNRINSPFD